VHARTFVVSPKPSFGVRLQRDVDLCKGESVLANLTYGPLVLPQTWMVETHDRDDDRLEIRGAEGYEKELLWDHQVLLGEGGGGRCIVEYRVTVPGKRRLRSGGIQVRPVFERRHAVLRAKATTPVAQWPVF
jgi:hypothetical protein